MDLPALAILEAATRTIILVYVSCVSLGCALGARPKNAPAEALRGPPDRAQCVDFTIDYGICMESGRNSEDHLILPNMCKIQYFIYFFMVYGGAPGTSRSRQTRGIGGPLDLAQRVEFTIKY